MESFKMITNRYDCKGRISLQENNSSPINKKCAVSLHEQQHIKDLFYY